VFIGFLALQAVLPMPPRIDFPLRVIVLAAILVFYSRPVIELKPHHLLASLALGVVVFVIWIAPDMLIPHYRQSWLFQNAITGAAASSLAASLRDDRFVLTFRVLRAVVIVP